MAEIQTDFLKGTCIIVAEKRSTRPKVTSKAKVCPFDTGNESMTTASTLEVVTFDKGDKSWKVRAMENRFPALTLREKYQAGKISTGAYGCHEVIVETPHHSEQFETFSKKQLELVFEAYVNRYKAISRTKGIKYAYLFKNHGENGGASIDHEHTQIIGLPFVPEMNKLEFAGKTCAFCKLLKRNVVFENKWFVAVRPEVARFGLECWIIAKRHVGDLTQLSGQEGDGLMAALQEIVRRVKRKTDSYNFAFHNAVNDKGHFHVEVYPRIDHWAGLELGTGVIMNTMGAKTAVKILKEKG